MISAILGDMIGAPYEFDRGNKTKVFPLFSRKSQFTDSLEIAVASERISLYEAAQENLCQTFLDEINKQTTINLRNSSNGIF